MIYPQRDNRRKRKKVVVTTSILGGVLALIIILNLTNPNLFTPFLQAAGRPVLEGRGGVLGSLNNVWQFFHSKAELVTENKALQEQLALTDAVELERDYYKYYNAELLNRVGQIEEQKNTTVAQIISKPGFSPYDTLIIDVGTRDGVAVGDSVLADESVILGEITEVYQHSAMVMLYSSPDKETQVLIGPHALEATAVGQGAGNFEIKLPRNTDVNVGDIVAMASSTMKVFGKIEVINTTPTDTFERALFKSAIDVSTLPFVYVEKKS